MKTTREILLERHHAAVPKLDAMRREVVGKLNDEATKEQGRRPNFVAWLLGCSNTFWCELIFPCRRIWTGLAAVWIAIVAINVSQREHLPSVIGRSPDASAIASFREQQKVLSELLADRSLPVDAEPPKVFSPKPRTEIVGIQMV